MSQAPTLPPAEAHAPTPGAEGASDSANGNVAGPLAVEVDELDASPDPVVAVQPQVSEPPLPQIIDNPEVEEPQDEPMVTEDVAELSETNNEPSHAFAGALSGLSTLGAEAEGVAALAAFLHLDSTNLDQCDPQVVKAMMNRFEQFTQLLLESEFLKLNLENSTQNLKRLVDLLQQKLHQTQLELDNLKSQRQSLNQASQSQAADLEAARGQIDQLQTKVDQLLDELATANEHMDRQRQQGQQLMLDMEHKVDQAMASQVEAQQQVNQMTQKLATTEKDLFALKLSLIKAENRVKYLDEDLSWHQQELALAQSRYAAVVKQHHQEQAQQQTRMSQLTTRNEQLDQLNLGLKATIDEVNAQLQQEISRAGDAQQQAKTEIARLRDEAARATDLAEAAQRKLDQQRQRISELERFIDELKQRGETSLAQLQLQVQEKTTRVAELEEKLLRAEEAISLDIQRDAQLPALALGLNLIALQANISLTDLYTEYSHLKKQLVMERSQNDKLTHQMSKFVTDLERRKPQLAAYHEQVEMYQRQLHEMTGKVEQIRLEREEANKTSSRLRQRLIAKENEVVQARKMTRDLGRQVCYLLIHTRDDDTPLLSAERKVIDKIMAQGTEALSDTDMLISQRLVEFKNIVELEKQNQNLLHSIHELLHQLEASEHQGVDLELAAIDEAKQAILLLQGEIELYETRYQAVVKERDMLKLLRQLTTSGDKFLIQTNNDLRQQLEKTEQVLEQLRTELRKTISDLRDRVQLLSAEKNKVELELSQAQLTCKLAEARLELATKQVQNSEVEVKQLGQEISFWRGQLLKQEEALVAKLNQLHEVDTQLAEARLKLQLAQLEKQHLNNQIDNFREEAVKLKADKQQLQEFVGNLQQLLSEREALTKEVSAQLTSTVKNYNELQQRLSDREERVALLAQQTELALKAQNAKVDQINEISRALLEARHQLAEKEREVEQLNKKLSATHAATVSPQSAEPVASTKSDLSDDIEVQQLKEDLKAAEAQVEELSNLAKASEQALIQQTNSLDDYKRTTTEKIADLEKQVADLSAERNQLLTKFQETSKQLDDEINARAAERAQLLLDHEEALAKARNYDTMQRDFEAKLELVSRDLDTQHQLTQQTQDKFQAELKRSGDQAELISQLRDQVDDYRRQLDTSSRELEQAKKGIDARIEALSGERGRDADEVKRLQQRVNELTDQNQLLLNQIELLKSSSTGSTTVEGEDNVSDIVAYLRRDNQKLQAQVDQLAADARELLAKVSQLEVSLVQAQLDLSFARSQAETGAASGAQERQRLDEMLGQVNLMRESNTTLRHERDEKAAQVATITKQLELLTAQLDPLKAEVSLLKTQAELSQLQAKLAQEEGEKLRQQLSEAQLLSLLADKERIAELEQQLNQNREKSRERVFQANQKLKNQNETIGRLNTQIEEQKTTVQSLEKQIAELKLAPAPAADGAAAAAAATSQEETAEWEKQKQQFEQEKQGWSKKEQELRTQIDQLTKQLAQAKADAATVGSASTSSDNEKKLQAELTEAKSELTKVTQKHQVTEMKMKMMQKKLERLEKLEKDAGTLLLTPAAGATPTNAAAAATTTATAAATPATTAAPSAFGSATTAPATTSAFAQNPSAAPLGAKPETLAPFAFGSAKPSSFTFGSFGLAATPVANPFASQANANQQNPLPFGSAVFGSFGQPQQQQQQQQKRNSPDASNNNELPAKKPKSSE